MKEQKQTYTRGRKLNSEILSVRDDKKAGKITQMIFQRVRPLVRESTGEIVTGNFDQELYVIDGLTLDTEEPRTFWCDAGLRGTLAMANVKEGQAIEIEHTGSKKLDARKNSAGVEIPAGTVQTYEVFTLEVKAKAVKQ